MEISKINIPYWMLSEKEATDLADLMDVVVEVTETGLDHIVFLLPTGQAFKYSRRGLESANADLLTKQLA